jgi:hypothetical protein
MRVPKPWYLAVVLAVATFLLTAPALAQSEETRATSLDQDAMSQDYLATDFKAALAKLKTALRVCGASKCSKKLLAHVYSDLGIVYSAGLNHKDDAVEAFKQALTFDSTVTPDSNYLTGDVQKAFERAKAAIAPGLAAKHAIGVLQEQPWTEQATWNPIPVFVRLPPPLKATRVVVSYKAPGSKQWTELPLSQRDGGWGGYIPCAAVEKVGELTYFVTAFDVNLDRIASAGSAEKPRRVALKKAINGRLPSLPGETPPSACPRPVERLSCGSNDDCPGTQVCKDLYCVDESSVAVPQSPEESRVKKNWISVSFSPDLSFVSSTNDACSGKAQSGGSQSCFYGNGQQYPQSPDQFDPALQSGSSNTLNGGVALGTMRVEAAYDRVIGKRMTVGARAGFIFLGPPKRNDGKAFLPLHLSARFAFYLAKDPFAKKGVRPYAFVEAGLGESAAHVLTPVGTSEGTGPSTSRNLDVYQTGGPAFGGAGVGVQYAVSLRAALVIEVAGHEAFPNTQTVIQPLVGFAYGL